MNTQKMAHSSEVLWILILQSNEFISSHYRLWRGSWSKRKLTAVLGCDWGKVILITYITCSSCTCLFPFFKSILVFPFLYYIHIDNYMCTRTWWKPKESHLLVTFMIHVYVCLKNTSNILHFKNVPWRWNLILFLFHNGIEMSWMNTYTRIIILLYYV